MYRFNSTYSLLTVVQPPTSVQLTLTSKSTARVTWSAVSGVLLYQVTLSDSDDYSVAPIISRTSATTLDITDLQPCSNYIVGVSSVNNFLVAGEPADITHPTHSEFLIIDRLSCSFDPLTPEHLILLLNPNSFLKNLLYAALSVVLEPFLVKDP